MENRTELIQIRATPEEKEQFKRKGGSDGFRTWLSGDGRVDDPASMGAGMLNPPMVETKIRRAANRSSAPAAAPAVPEKPRGSYATVCESNPEHHPRCSCDKCKTKRGPAA